jgi:BirA family biotin operon repressor/biotin-[acetyl-CoA-carboxylase] ligase
LEKLGLLPLLTGVSIVQSIKSSASIQTGLKWPNDIMLNGKKMGGILIESRTTQNRLGVVVGVGLNINETKQDIPNFLKDQTTSLAIYSEASCNREQILSAVLNKFERLYIQEWDSIIPIWRKYCIHKDSVVVFHTENGLHQGIFQGISSDGHAEIQINGKTQTFPSGMIML